METTRAKQARDWSVDRGETSVTWYRCPLKARFGCCAEIKIYGGLSFMALETRGVHDADSHHPDKDRSKHLKVKQIEAIQTGVRVSPNQSTRQLRLWMGQLHS